MRSFAVFLSLTAAVPHLAAAATPIDLQPRGVTEPAADPPGPRIGTAAATAIATGAFALWAASEIEQARDHVTGCRWCEPGRFDRWARDGLRWSATGSAGKASDLLLLGVPLGSAAAIAWLDASDGAPPRAVVEDVFVIAAAIAVTDPLTTGVKHATARLRPEAWAAGGPRVNGDLHSFFSGHTSRVFAASAAAAQVARLRGRSGWKWVAAIGFGAAAATGWLRIAADQHWATDVLAGAAVGTAAGFGVATVGLRPEARPPRVTIVPAPGGLAVLF